MKLALIGMIAVGAAAGLALPHGAADTAARDRDAASVAVADVPPRAPAPVRAAPGWGGETHLRRGESGHFLANGLVNGQPVRFVVDTGASIVALTVDDARRIGIPYDPAAFQVIGSGASGAVRGVEVAVQSVAVDGKEVRTLRAAVIEGLDVSLLGQSYLSRIGGVSMMGDEMVLR